eukprot:1140771-Pelagomonas_calceolata.AAC.20
MQHTSGRVGPHIYTVREAAGAHMTRGKQGTGTAPPLDMGMGVLSQRNKVQDKTFIQLSPSISRDGCLPSVLPSDCVA